MKIKKINYYLLTKYIGFYINTIGLFAPKKAAQIAYKIFCKPRKGRLNLKHLPEILKTVTHEKFEFKNEIFQTYVWKGNDQIILLIHGWESNASRWRKLLPSLLSTGKTIIAVDAPAHGLSTKGEFNVPKYVQFIEILTKKYTPNILIGHSIGGFACIYYQYLHQNAKLEKIILLGTPSDLDLMFNNYYNIIGLSSRVRRYFEEFIEPKINMKIDEFAAKNFVKSISTKALIIHDSMDSVVKIEEGEKIMSNWKNAAFFETYGLGHGLNDPIVFKKIVDFIENR